MGETGRLVSIGDCLRSVLESSGLASRLRYPQIEEAWSSVVGPDISSHTCIAGYRKGTLEITVDSSSLMQDLRMCERALLQEISARVRRPYVSRLRFVLGAGGEQDGQQRDE